MHVLTDVLYAEEDLCRIEEGLDERQAFHSGLFPGRISPCDILLTPTGIGKYRN